MNVQDTLRKIIVRAQWALGSDHRSEINAIFGEIEGMAREAKAPPTPAASHGGKEGERITETITFHFDNPEQQRRFHERLNSPSPLPCGEEELASALALAMPDDTYEPDMVNLARAVLSHLNKTGVDAAGPRDTSAIGCADCPKCDNRGWVWAHELDTPPDYGDPSRSPMSDDTKYQCDHESHAQERGRRP